MDANIKKLILLAESEIGYLEKKSNSQLDDKTANAGSNNYTKYGRDMVKWVGSPYTNGAAWCQTFISYCLCSCFGVDQAKRLSGGWSAYTPTSAQYYKNMGRWYTSNPQPGDQIFFKNTQRICHTGLVYSVDANYVYTIEGNTSGASGVIANGGGVCNKKYALNYKNIAGYGRPNYSILEGGDGINVPQEQPMPATTKTTNPYPTPVVTVKKGNHGTNVKWVQWQLNAILDAKLVVDGSFGDLTFKAVMAFQDRYKLEIDGIVGPVTRNTMIQVLN